MLGLVLAYAAGRETEALPAATGPSALMTLAGGLQPAILAVGVNPIEVMRSE